MSTETDSSASTNTNISFITSNKGQRLLVMNDYIFRCNKKTTKKKYWMCAVSGCAIRIQTDENDIYLCGGKGAHEHEASSDLIDTTRLRQQIKQRVVSELTPLNMIYEQEIAKASLNISALANFPTNHEIYQTFAKARQRIVPPLPQSCLFTIPDPYKLTVDGTRFLLLDESRVRRERMLIYASDFQLDILFKSPVVYMDGTYSKTPPQFYQVYIIHGINYDICLPCVFVLMLNKKSSTYRQIFFELKQLALERQISFSPNLIVTDFESGVLPIIKTEFPEARRGYRDLFFWDLLDLF